MCMYWLRTLTKLRALSAQLRCNSALLEPMITCATQTVLAHARAELAAPAATSVAATAAGASTGGAAATPRSPPTSALQERAMRLMAALSDTGEMLGGQACLIVNGKTVVDAAIGQMGAVDPRPVRSDSLFQLFGAGSPLLSTLVLKEVQRGALRLDAPVAATWPEFAAGGKTELTISQLLNHQTGLSGAIPERARLSELCALERMTELIAKAAADPEEAADAQNGQASHEGLPWGWAIAGALQVTSEMGLEALLNRRLLEPLGLAEELMLRVASASALERCAKHSAVALMREAGLDVTELMGGGAPDGGGVEPEEGGGGTGAATGTGGEGGGGVGAGATGAGTSGGDDAEGGSGGGRTAEASNANTDSESAAAASDGGIDWGRFQGARQLMSPSTLHMRRMMAEVLPGISAHGSAHALAQFYAALGAGKIIPPSLLSQAQLLAVSGVGPANEAVRFGLGFQLGTCTDVGPLHGLQQGPLQRVNMGLVNDAVGLVNEAASAVRGGVRGLGHGLGLGGEGNSRLHAVLGHAAVGGTLAFCVPERRVAMAVTVSRLSGARVATRKLLDLLMGEVGLTAPSGL